ncbi:hypothetical protein DFJ74DRAFT_717598 [Hyaloraphidium curvatum]|nr:hypothetical protein DFJ74DRAFT_717598 [Hyaloraphidium curvatum]
MRPTKLLPVLLAASIPAALAAPLAGRGELAVAEAGTVTFAASCGSCPSDAFCEFGYDGAPAGRVACVVYGNDAGNGRLSSLYRRYDAACDPGPDEVAISVSGASETVFRVGTGVAVANIFRTPASGKLALASLRLYLRGVSSNGPNGTVAIRLHAHDDFMDSPEFPSSLASWQPVEVDDKNTAFQEFSIAFGGRQLQPSTSYWFSVSGASGSDFEVLASASPTGSQFLGYSAAFDRSVVITGGVNYAGDPKPLNYQLRVRDVC